MPRKNRIDKMGAVLIIGGGIAGIQSSLDIANSGFRVYLVESGGTIGGKIAQLDCLQCKVCHRYFPQTKEYEKIPCGICYFPKILEDVKLNKNIEILTHSHIKNIEKKGVNFVVSISKHSQYENKNKPIFSEIISEVYENDITNQEKKNQNIEITVGAIILSPGFEEFDAKIKSEYGYGRYKNVLTSLEFERIFSSSGSYQGHLVRLSDNKEPKKIAWINCVGSRDKLLGNNYCSSVCCTYAIKEAVIAKEHIPTIEPTIFYMDMRAYGKGSDAYYERAKDEHGIRFLRCRISDIQEDPKTKNLLIKYETEDGNLKEEEFDMVVLSVGFEPNDKVKELAEKLGIKLNEYGFCETSELSPLETNQPGILVCGTFSGPKDIPDTMIEASGAAAEVGSLIALERNNLVEKEEYPPEINVDEDAPRIGVFICNCGTNIGACIDVPSVVEYAKTLPNVVYAEDNTYTCSQDTRNKMIEKIKEHKLNRLIVASGTPRTHEPLFQETIREAGLNPHLFEMANIRDQCSWVHIKEPEKATEKAKDLVRIAVAKVGLMESLSTNSFKVTQKGLVIGGGLAGMISALTIADQGYDVHLIEKEDVLGGNLRNIHYTLENEDIQSYLRDVINKVENNPHIKVFKNSRVEKMEGHIGNYSTTINDGANQTMLEHGVVIVATGAEEFKPKEYLYGKDERVITQLELERQLANDADFNKKTIVMIQCVGSRDEEHKYCSRICCTSAIKNALKLKEENPDAQIYILYRDMRTYGFRESFYEEAREKGIIFIRYVLDKKPIVQKNSEKLEVLVRDLILGEKLLIHADFVVLSPAIVSREDSVDLAKQLKVPLNKEEFFHEVHIKLRPVDSFTDGIFLCGLAHSPRFIGESIVQAKAASARAITIISKEYLKSKGDIAHVSSRNCVGCKLCIEVCPYDSITFDEEKKIVVVNEILCQSCGICAAVCLSGVSQQSKFTKRQILSMVDSCLE